MPKAFFVGLFLIAVLAMATVSYAGHNDEEFRPLGSNEDWFIKQIHPQFESLFRQCGCPVYGYDGFVTWEGKPVKNTPKVIWWEITVIISKRKTQTQWQTLGRVFTYKKVGNGPILLYGVGPVFIWNPT